MPAARMAINIKRLNKVKNHKLAVFAPATGCASFPGIGVCEEFESSELAMYHSKISCEHFINAESLAPALMCTELTPRWVTSLATRSLITNQGSCFSSSH